jgi:adenosylmethionine-8-amino-7-oxononanoate aminotransferase
VAVDVVSLVELDQRHVWHPYGPMPAMPPPLPVMSAAGVRLRLSDGRDLIDGMSSWWCVVHGYRHPVLDAAVRDQLEQMAHVMFGGLTHEPGVRLARRLVELTPEGLEHVFFADSGSVAIEVAIKMCLQYWLALGRPERRRLLAVRGGYHGDTFGAMAVCDPVEGMHGLFRGALTDHVFVDLRPPGFDAPLHEPCARHLTDTVRRHADELAGVIVEPVVQGAGGMHFYSPSVVRLLRELCDAHGLPLVLDEIATGFGRTGALFACHHAGVAPDVMCLGKALTGGYLSLAATLCTRRIAEAISTGQGRALMHGPTYMATHWRAQSPLPASTCSTPAAGRTRCGGSSAGLPRGWHRHESYTVSGRCGCSGRSASSSSSDLSTWPPPRRQPLQWECGFARSGSSCTRCRRTSPARTIWLGSQAAVIAAARAGAQT